AQDYETLEYKGYFDYNGVSANRSENYFAKPKSNADILKELAENQRFYKVHEIQFDDIKTTTENDGWVAIDLKGKLGDNLLVQPELKTESFSNIKARNQMTYNSMLHAWDIKNVIGRGWPMNYFYPNIGIGQFEAIGQSEVEEQGWRESIEVKIKTDVGVSSVVRITPELQGEYLKLFNLSPMLSYPDARATEMVIYRSYFDVSEGRYLELKDTFRLTASDTGSFAYYISPNLKPIILISERYEDNQTDIPSESNQELSYQNKLKVSNTNNPFLFPDTQTYQIGDGSILNVASQSIRTSDGQFGQFPLICFCTDGVFSLEVGDGTVAYSRQVKPQSYERPISKVICTTPFGILFISNRGLCMVAGQDVIYLSETMFEKFRNITLELPTSIASSFSFDTGLFNDYLKDCSAMVYNPKEQEVIIINPNKEFNYVYNFSTKQFYKNDEQITNEINNSLPSLQVWKGLLVKNVTRTEAGQRKITFTTRPIKMQTTDFKRFERVILRGYLSQLSGAVACIWGSIDDRNFKLLRGITLTDNTTRKDLDFGMFGKTTYRSYIIGLSMTVGTDSEIEAIEMEIEKLYNNTNMQ
ncbi:MAG TPA: hypothetical protein DCS19_09590, partial [Flavobacterium sp.]|nr:hypothetical protein [Flavobacterium sp.]